MSIYMCFCRCICINVHSCALHWVYSCTIKYVCCMYLSCMFLWTIAFVYAQDTYVLEIYTVHMNVFLYKCVWSFASFIKTKNYLDTCSYGINSPQCEEETYFSPIRMQTTYLFTYLQYKPLAQSNVFFSPCWVSKIASLA